ncbi:cobalt-precorrin-5B (C(1))-methyltransferase CbiD [soil metagenome]
MSTYGLLPFNIADLAENGLRRGRTTGTCAAAAAKAATLKLQGFSAPDEVDVALPDGMHFLRVPIAKVEQLSDHCVQAQVIKEAGDDPDATDGATITCKISRNDRGAMKFIAGIGVGVVTEPGIRVPVGEAAINPSPRKMILAAIEDIVEPEKSITFDIEIGCLNGENISLKTFNPRLGIKGGISILGTTGIVEPMSLAAYVASIEVYIRVALGNNKKCIALLPGNIGINFASKKLVLQRKQIVHISNFVGRALDAVQETLTEEASTLSDLWLLGHPGKLAKLLEGNFDTHSRASNMAMPAIARFAEEFGLSTASVKTLASANTVEAICEILKEHPQELAFWSALEQTIAKLAASKTPAVSRLHVKLFKMDGSELGQSGTADIYHGSN